MTIDLLAFIGLMALVLLLGFYAGLEAAKWQAERVAAKRRAARKELDLAIIAGQQVEGKYKATANWTEEERAILQRFQEKREKQAAGYR